MVFERAAMRDSQRTGVHHVPEIEVSEYMQVTLSGVAAVHRCQVLCFNDYMNCFGWPVYGHAWVHRHGHRTHISTVLVCFEVFLEFLVSLCHL